MRQRLEIFDQSSLWHFPSKYIDKISTSVSSLHLHVRYYVFIYESTEKFDKFYLRHFSSEYIGKISISVLALY